MINDLKSMNRQQDEDREELRNFRKKYEIDREERRNKSDKKIFAHSFSRLVSSNTI